MAHNVLTVDFAGQAGVLPRLCRLVSSESYDILTAPGYLNSVANSGIEILPSDFIFANYNNGLTNSVFIASVNEGIYTMQIYNPGNGGFQFQNTIFVAKGGSDLNSGDQMSFPKLTVQAAIDALQPSQDKQSLVVILDDGTYSENITLPFNIQIQGPNASFEVNSGDVFTVNDTGQQSLAIVNCASIFAGASGNIASVSGASSSLFINSKINQGNLYIEGGVILNCVALVVSTITIASGGQFGPNIINAISCTIVNDGHIYGNIGQIPSIGNTAYGNQTFVDKILFQTEIKTETAGKVLSSADGVSTLVFNEVSDGNYTLPATADAAIPVGSFVDFVQLGLGRIVFLAGAGVTIVSVYGNSIRTIGPGAKCQALKYTDTVWIISGDIETQP